MSLITADAVKGDSTMTTYTIDKENGFTAFAAAKEAKKQHDAEVFDSVKELSQLAEQWPAARLVAIWNTLPGVTPVAKFANRKAAVGRIWTAIQSLVPTAGPQGPRVARKKGRLAENPSAEGAAPSARPGSRKAEILALLQRDGGATLQELMSATGWQAHSVRGFLAGALRKKMGLAVDSSKREDGQRVYAIGN
jgi:hypothetical protein